MARLLLGKAVADAIDEKTIVLEIMNAFKRAGAKMVITYHAIDLGNWLKENR